MAATDLDGTEFGEIRYDISQGDPDNLFDINPESGYVYIVAPLDRETVRMGTIDSLVISE